MRAPIASHASRGVWRLLLSVALVLSALTSPDRLTATRPVAMPRAANEPTVARAPTPTPTHTPSPTATTDPSPTPAAFATPTASVATVTPTVQAIALSTPRPTWTRTPVSANTKTPTAEPTLAASRPITQVLGRSTLRWSIVAYRFGTGATRVALVGGIHGGYEWNTILLAYEVIDYFTAHPERVPRWLSLYVVPAANPDGLARLVNHAGRFSPDELPAETAPGRFNGNDVDLNRNWDVNWVPTGVWGTREVDAGGSPFSEVETRVLRDFLSDPEMDAVVFWHSAHPGVYMAACEETYPPSQALAGVYATAADYPLYEEFYEYSVTGNATDWLACQEIAAIAIELTDHTNTDRSQNLAGVQAVIDYLRPAFEP